MFLTKLLVLLLRKSLNLSVAFLTIHECGGVLQNCLRSRANDMSKNSLKES